MKGAGRSIGDQRKGRRKWKRRIYDSRKERGSIGTKGSGIEK